MVFRHSGMCIYNSNAHNKYKKSERKNAFVSTLWISNPGCAGYNAFQSNACNLRPSQPYRTCHNSRGLPASSRFFIVMAFQQSRAQSSTLRIARQPSSRSARAVAATQDPTSPSRLGLRAAGTGRCVAASKLAMTSATVMPLPVPRLYVLKASFRSDRTAARSAAMWPWARSTTWMKSRTAVPSRVSQSLPNMCNWSCRPSTTDATTGNRFVGFCRGSSRSIPDAWHPTGLKYRSAVIRIHGLALARSARMASAMYFVRP